MNGSQNAPPSRKIGLAWRPRLRHVITSNSSSIVPMPPGSTTIASDRSNIAALRSCSVAVTITRSGPPARLRRRRGISGMMPTTGRRRERGAGGEPHQAVAAAAVDQRQAARGAQRAERRGQRGMARIGAGPRTAEQAQRRDRHRTVPRTPLWQAAGRIVTARLSPPLSPRAFRLKCVTCLVQRRPTCRRRQNIRCRRCTPRGASSSASPPSLTLIAGFGLHWTTAGLAARGADGVDRAVLPRSGADDAGRRRAAHLARRRHGLHGRDVAVPRQLAGDGGLGELVATRVSVFMNVFDVHVNRTPISGTVTRIAYVPGKFLNADLDKASDDNERQYFIVEGSDGTRVGFTQIAGLVARRIVRFVEPGRPRRRRAARRADPLRQPGRRLSARRAMPARSCPASAASPARRSLRGAAVPVSRRACTQ